MSRPKLSVPKGNAADGGRKRNRTFIADGSTLVRKGAKIAASAKSKTSTRPIRNNGCAASPRNKTNRLRGASVPATAPTARSVIPHARVEHRVKQIDRQVYDDKREAVDEHHALHQGIVARQNALDHKAANARQREHLLENN